MRILLPITEVSVIKPSWQEIFACLLTGVPAGSLPHVLRFLGALDDRRLEREEEEDRLDLLRMRCR